MERVQGPRRAGTHTHTQKEPHTLSQAALFPRLFQRLTATAAPPLRIERTVPPRPVRVCFNNKAVCFRSCSCPFCLPLLLPSCLRTGGVRGGGRALDAHRVRPAAALPATAALQLPPGSRCDLVLHSAMQAAEWRRTGARSSGRGVTRTSPILPSQVRGQHRLRGADRGRRGRAGPGRRGVRLSPPPAHSPPPCLSASLGLSASPPPRLTNFGPPYSRAQDGNEEPIPPFSE